MNKTLIMSLLLIISLQQTVLLRSDPSTTIITSSNHITVTEAYHTKNNPNFIGHGANWIYKKGLDSWPAGDKATFYAEFWADCQREAILTITADDSFSASVNGGTVLKGNEKG